MFGGFYVWRRQRKWAVNELVRKSEELKRLPRKDDFDDATRSRIKAF